MKNSSLIYHSSCLLAGLLILIGASPAFAYIGPGAGFAFLSSFLVFFLIFILAALLFITWPIRWTWRALLGKKAHKHGLKGRVVIVGLDGLDPDRCRRMMDNGELPNLKRLNDEGSFRKLATTNPAISPVAWSSFQTGVNPASHNVYDFLAPDRRTYLPILSSAHIGTSRKILKLGKWRIPLTKPEIRLNRKSKPFWSILGEHYIFSSVIRVPITFPPEKFNGVLLSAMCAPDLRGTQGTFTYFTDDPNASSIYAGGTLVSVKRDGNKISTALNGPENTLKDGAGVMTVPLKVTLEGDSGAKIKLDDNELTLKVGQSSEWLRVVFKPGLGIAVYGICRLYLKSLAPHFGLYVSPINIDPDKPALPISHPIYYSSYLAKIIGPYATLGLAEDTWALNEGALTEEAFLEQCWRHHAEREKMLFDAIEHTPRGCVVCVFDTTDRIQHMFSKYLIEDHPARRGVQLNTPTDDCRNAIPELYRRCDALIGKVREKLDKNDVLIVMSDHGFKVFRRGINVNSWLKREGYLFLKEGSQKSGEWFEAVDWSKTKAYSLGLGGIFINRAGREKHGVVQPGDEAKALVKEISAKLTGLKDPVSGEVAINRAYPSWESYAGPYIDNAPDVIVGCADGYRLSWDGVTGVVNDSIFEDNIKNWSGDHCVDPAIVPGVFFCSLKTDKQDPRIMDIAPTVLKLYGIDKPAYMDGEPIPLKQGETS